MTQPPDTRSAALDAYLVDRETDGYLVETRTKTQAVIVRKQRMFAVLNWLRRGSGQERHVVSVDEHGVVSAVEAEPVRW